MSNNVLLAHELFHFINSKKSKISTYAAIKIDLNKAYDGLIGILYSSFCEHMVFLRLEFNGLVKVFQLSPLQNLGNSNIFDPLFSKCGLRQGDVISPYLFILCMDIYSRMLTIAEHLRLIKGIRVIRKSPSISHLFLLTILTLFEDYTSSM